MQHAARACCILAPCPNHGSSHDSLRNKSHQRICMLCADAHISCFCSPVPLGPAIGHLCSFSSFSTFSGYYAPVFCPRSLEVIVAIATGVLRGMGHLRHECAHPVGRRPRRHVSRRSKAPFFFAFRTRFFSHNLFGCPSGFVVSDSTKPDGNGPALWSCWVPLNVFRCRIPAPIPAVSRARGSAQAGGAESGPMRSRRTLRARARARARARHTQGTWAPTGYRRGPATNRPVACGCA